MFSTSLNFFSCNGNDNGSHSCDSTPDNFWHTRHGLILYCGRL